MIWVFVVTILISPFVLILAAKQDKKTKNYLKLSWIVLLALQTFLGFLNWENFTIGRSGIELSLTYPNSLLGLFFVISILQIFFLLVNKSFNTLVVALNFANTILIFAGMIRLSGILGYQALSFASIGAVFLVLIENIIGLAFINKDKNLLKKYPFLK